MIVHFFPFIVCKSNSVGCFITLSQWNKGKNIVPVIFLITQHIQYGIEMFLMVWSQHQKMHVIFILMDKSFYASLLYTIFIEREWFLAEDPLCFINEDACSTEGGVEKLVHTACGTRSLSALKCMIQGS